MHSTVDPACFVDTVTIFRPRVIVTCLQFLQGNFVWRIAVYFICTEKNEDRFGTMLPSRLQKIYGTQSVDFEIQQRNFPRFVVGRLSRAVHYQIELLAGEKFLNRAAIANIQRGVSEALASVFEALQ